MTTGTDRRKAAYAKLAEVVSELIDIANHDEDDDGMPIVPVDYVLLIGGQWITSDGDRRGGVACYPKDGSQPRYITAGLLADAQAMHYNDNGASSE
ncbi:Uncharacterised protein [Mycobacteroides abscessus subsp. bolletii]|uniref:DUF7213 family protein n=1 Tax=Mycobacteroides abscessus TaxID=36809 RepID=UPI000928801E|nr:hypothetical protein [Mycobacteroides abscessus]SHX92338.1 Uncharacterised protein [Mycobacteroides abscessus subsp. bolletii]SKP82828.1 Uncharacterised protein [Mycobacteroides abscessus subsp. bolletii]SKP99301.1 Uncharacterised protein [Mycobacteroides abscessus subsp. bolletii]SKQ16835.1 Uncharacterised protein [Mycobacteroides abscessus subsp. bolletii]SKU71907.1 Uncharacterised protein [Mycobacteroides abscessus subsp. massiliense]